MKKWQKVTGITLVSLIGAICVLYICLTSEWFIQKQVLPRVSKSVGQSITVDGIDLSLFSGVDIRNLEVGSGSNQLLRAGTIRLHYRLMPLFSGELAVDEILLDDVKVQITPESAAAPQAKPASEPVVSAKKEGGGGLPLKPVIRNVRIKNTHVFVKQNGADGKPLEFALENFNLELPEFKLDQMARIDLNGTLRLMQGPDVQLKNATLKGNIQAQIDSP
ncbi:MAG: hypothetical protein FJ220_07735, partial [Kiritimatiellaceae bacterium]|nr:hypothetical protein [Kiritimatiellaceae bacterium]